MEEKEAMSLEDEEGYVYRKEMTLRKVKIPEGCVKCPQCKGSGEVRIYYGQPWDRGQFASCVTCAGRGYVEKEVLDFLEKMNAKRKEKRRW